MNRGWHWTRRAYLIGCVLCTLAAAFGWATFMWLLVPSGGAM